MTLMDLRNAIDDYLRKCPDHKVLQIVDVTLWLPKTIEIKTNNDGLRPYMINIEQTEGYQGL